MDVYRLVIEGVGRTTPVSAILATILEHTRLRKDQVGKISFLIRGFEVEMLNLANEDRQEISDSLDGVHILGRSCVAWWREPLTHHVHAGDHMKALMERLEKEAALERRELENQREPLRGLDLDEWSVHRAGRLMVCLRDAQKRPLDCPWRRGASLELRNASGVSWRGVLQGFDGRQMVVILNAGTEAVDDLKGSLGLWHLGDQVSHERRRESLHRILGSSRAWVSKYLNPLEQLPRSSKPYGESEVISKEGDSSNSHLNKKQEMAYRQVVDGDGPLALIHGPPGTGKSTVLLACLRTLISQGKRILVTANSNAAVDHLLRSCADMDVVKFRMGHPARVHNDCTPYLLDELVKKELDAPSIKALEKQLKNIRTKLQGGGLPKPLYRDLKKELKDLEQERRSMEHRVEEHLWSEVQMVFVTNTGISSSWFGGRVFDVLVMDEAAQCIEPDAWIPMFYGKRVVMAGDPKQLGAVLHSKSRTLSRSLMQRYMDMGVPVTMLSTQYRMHPEIAQFSSERYYDGDLVSPEVMASQSLCQLLGDGLAEWLPLMFVDMAGVDGGEQRLDDSYMNELEGRFVIQRVLELLKLGLNPESIGVIAPYSAQVKWIRDHLKDRFTDIAKLEVQTVDGFQGREKEVIFFSAVRNSGELGFLRDAERLNVALTRAKSHLCVIGESSTLALDKDWDAFMAHCEAVGAYRSIWEFEV